MMTQNDINNAVSTVVHADQTILMEQGSHTELPPSTRCHAMWQHQLPQIG